MSRPGLGSNPATVTQVRTWVYNSNMQLDSVTHPESGTTTFAYNADGSLLRKTDQKGQKIENTYDSEGRVTAVRRYDAGGIEDACARVDYYYGTQSFAPSFTANATGRVAAVATGVQTGGCVSIGAGQLIEMYSYTAAGAVTKKRLRIIRSAGTVDKDVTYTYGTDGKLATILYPGANTPYTYTYDLLDRPTKMTGPADYMATSAVDIAKDVVYGVAGNVTSMKYLQYENSGSFIYYTETKSYNSLFQLTRQTTTGTGGGADIEYSFSASANNGRITGRKNYVSGEDVVYSYDELNRLVSASISGSGGWGQAYTHDGFGNLWTQAVTKGTAPSVSLSLDMAKNRVNSASWSYDNNGNTTSMTVLGGGSASMTYDIDNRLVSWTGAPGTEEYRYLADNKRVWKKSPSGAETYYFYGVGGQKLATYSVVPSPFSLVGLQDNVYFGGKLIRADGVSVVHDRLGSVVYRHGTGAKDYFPYGDEIGTATAGNVDKFGTYLRDQTTGLDYADQRYFGGLQGRFLTADPYEASGGAGEPGSWNRYPYVGGDPVNFGDPSGANRVFVDIQFNGSFICMMSDDGETVRQVGCTALNETNVRLVQAQLSRVGFESAFGRCNKSGTVAEEVNLTFVADFYQDAMAVQDKTGFDALWLLGWAGSESGGSLGEGYGTTTAATVNRNYFGLTPGSNWVGQADCLPGAANYACFNTFFDSAMSALTSTRTDPTSGVQWNVLDLYKSNTQDVTGFFQTVANLGHNASNRNYGTKATKAIDGVRKRVDCLKSIGRII